MIDALTLVRFAAALVFVLALIGVVAWLARRYLTTAAIGPTGKRRLAVVETAYVDGKSRLVLVRRDDREHLLVIGPAGPVVVEANIPAKPGEAPPAALRAVNGSER